jgi:predicted permease
MSSQSLSGGAGRDILLLFGIGVAQAAFVTLLSFPLARALRPPAEDRGIYRNFFALSNSGFMGFPVSLAIFGSTGMFYMVILNCILNVLLFSLGIWNVKICVRNKNKKAVDDALRDAAGGDGAAAGHEPDGVPWREVLKDVMSPPVIALLIGFLLLLTQISLPDGVMAILDSIGGTMAPLSMMVIGLQLTESHLGKVILNRRLIIMSLIRLIGLGALSFIILLPFYRSGVISPMAMGVLTLNLMLPCAAMIAVFAEEYGGNVKIAAEGVFLSTLFSIVTIPVLSVLLTTFII